MKTTAAGQMIILIIWLTKGDHSTTSHWGVGKIVGGQSSSVYLGLTGVSK